MESILLITLISSALRATTPLLLAALGGLFSERSGVVNIALEGIMLFGALIAVLMTYCIENMSFANNTLLTLAPWMGLVCAMIVGGVVGWLHAFISIRYQADQIISGTAINLMGLGVPPVILLAVFGSTTASESVDNRLPLWEIGVFAGSNALSPLIFFALLLVPIVYIVLFRTSFGLRLRAVGEHPEAADSVGINVRRMRYQAVVISGVLAGLAGAFLSIGTLNQFISNMSSGRGFIALAALIFGKWHPLGVLGATLLFGVFDAAATVLGGGELLPSTIVSSLPYILTMLVLAGFIGRAVPPRAIGKPYEK